MPLPALKVLRGDARAFGHRFEFCPDDLRIADTRAEAAVGAAHDVLPADDLGVAHQPVGDRLWMLDDIRRMADDAGYEDLACGKLDLIPDAPFMLVAWVGRFDGNRVGFHFQDQVDDVAQRDQSTFYSKIWVAYRCRRGPSKNSSLTPFTPPSAQPTLLQCTKISRPPRSVVSLGLRKPSTRRARLEPRPRHVTAHRQGQDRA